MITRVDDIPEQLKSDIYCAIEKRENAVRYRAESLCTKRHFSLLFEGITVVLMSNLVLLACQTVVLMYDLALFDNFS
jgi:hypothetical protein